MPGTFRGQKRILGLLELKLEVVVGFPIWVLEIELRSPGKAESALNYQAISPTTESDSLPDYNMNGF